MAHYAFLDGNNVVTEVIVGNDETTGDWETYYGEKKRQRCVRTSYNGNIRKNYAGIGFTYDDARDAFIPPKPFESWVLDESTCCWVAPVALPEGCEGYEWDEALGDWRKPESPFASWVWDQTGYSWVAPVALPDDADTVEYVWDEASTSWVGVE